MNSQTRQTTRVFPTITSPTTTLASKRITQLSRTGQELPAQPSNPTRNVNPLRLIPLCTHTASSSTVTTAFSWTLYYLYC
uniref:Uncharacterized protein n=1 Tax=Panagrellus redivivus TaxID=6233 RepID=A0A7E4UUD7_PANRE